MRNLEKPTHVADPAKMTSMQNCNRTAKVSNFFKHGDIVDAILRI